MAVNPGKKIGSDNSATGIQIFFVLAVIVLLTFAVFSFLRIRALVSSSDTVNRTNIVKLKLEEVISTMTEAESSQRGYLLTRDSVFLIRFFEAKELFYPKLEMLALLTNDNPVQRGNLFLLEKLCRDRIDYLEDILEDRNDSLISKERWLSGKYIMDAVKSKVSMMNTEETRLLKERSNVLSRNELNTPAANAIFIICALLIIIFAYYRIMLELRRSKLLRNEQKLYQQELERKNVDLENMNNELQSFAYIASHDLQEPLRKIQIFTSRITENDDYNLPQDAQDYFDRIQESAKRMQTLIGDLLEYAQMNSRERKFENVQLSVIVAEVVSELKETINDKKATIHQKKLLEVTIIRFQFRQLLQNLINNALKFSRPGIPPEITIQCRIENGTQLDHLSLPADKNYCHVIVKDNGIGFDSTYNKQIFEIFQRLHGKAEYKGTGIGLAICKKIVENHEGVIMAESQPGHGSTFHVYIPHNIGQEETLNKYPKN